MSVLPLRSRIALGGDRTRRKGLRRNILPHLLTFLVGGAKFLYAGLKLLPVQRKVVLITREPRQISVDFELLRQAISRKHPEHRIVLIKHRKFSPGYMGKAVWEMYHLATCQACVVDGYIIPVSILNHRRDLQIGQIWHALGAIKNFGHLASGTREGPHPKVAEVMQMHQKYTFVAASGDVPADIYTAAFGVPRERILPLGMPRIDYLLDEEGAASRRERILQKYPQLAEGRTVLYVPTFRRGRQIPYGRLTESFDASQGNLVLIPHPFDRTEVEDDPGVVIDQSFSVLEWLSAADAVITDYSAVAYEAALRDVPLIFWPYDIEDYIRSRGLAVDYRAEVPGPVVESAQEAAETAQRIAEEHPDFRRFRSRHLNFIAEEDGGLPADPPRCAERIVDALKLR